MCSNVSAGLQLVWIIEVQDKQGPDDRGYTVVGIITGWQDFDHVKTDWLPNQTQ